MTVRTTTIEVDGAQYQVRRLLPEVGSYIWQLLMRAVFKAQQDNPQPESVQSSEPAPVIAPDARLRGFCAIAFMHMAFTDYKFMHDAALKVVSQMDGNGNPIPIMADNGQWAATDIADSPMLVTKLITESLAWNLQGFLG